ncbi:UDP-N-acetylglucosamine1-carboxyvinyltransferase [Striga asiatica]|uniref:UDP-N-acetylglucosamine1-carboxyvinyltransferase n=1 Tax=Striga asiatica TaxID=4170 RepID=A0A5A7RDY0_STRAF|nr:UDP-N-acetylglucosamine1-carboxyvinyltransferase [Striga asiatica]
MSIQGLHLSDGSLVKGSTKDLLWLLWKMQLDQRGKFSEIDLRLAQKNTLELLITIHNILIRTENSSLGDLNPTILAYLMAHTNVDEFCKHMGTDLEFVKANLEIVVLYVRPNSPKAIEMRTLRLAHKISEYGGQIHKVNQICYFLRVVRHGFLQSLWQHFHHATHEGPRVRATSRELSLVQNEESVFTGQVKWKRVALGGGAKEGRET